MYAKRISLILCLVLAVQTVLSGATYVVTNTADSELTELSVPGSLRHAIEWANDNEGADLIVFDIPTSDPGYDSGTDTFTIQLESSLPELTEQVAIDGYSQPGAGPATDASEAVLKIILDGSLGRRTLGLLSIDPGASACGIRGLVIRNYYKNGIFIESGADGNVIEGNYIVSNQECGIFIKSANNRIGGTTPVARNVISSNSWEGISIYGSEAPNNEVLGNFVGTDPSGMFYSPNGGIGAAINDAPDNVVGGTESGEHNITTSVAISNLGAINNRVVGNYIGINVLGDASLSGGYAEDTGVHIVEASHNDIGPGNVISGHLRGVVLWPGSSYNLVYDNYIGTDAAGQNPIGNEQDGVTVMGSHNQIEDNVVAASGSNGVYVARGWEPEHEMPSQNVVADNIIGLNTNGIVINTAVNTTISGNVISANDGTGVGVVNDLPWTGDDLSIGNRITQNAIYDNGGLGINLVPDEGVNPNDPGDIDVGPNNLMNFPVLTSALATPGQLIVRGMIDTPNPTSVRLEFFANSAPDDSTEEGYGEGEMYLGAARPNANGAFTAAVPAVSPGVYISATATDRDGNTSEFARCIEVTALGQP